MDGADHPTWLVAKREIREATRTTAFKVTLIISAVALAAIIVIANLGGGTDTQDVVVAGPDSSARATAVDQLARSAGIPVDVATAADDAAARRQVDGGQADLAVSVDGRTLTTRKPVDLEGDSKLATLINLLRPSLALDDGLRAAGLTPEQAEAVRAAEPPTVTSVHPADTHKVDPSKIAAATARLAGDTPAVRSTPITRAVTKAVTMSTAAWMKATRPMPAIFPLSSWRGVITASSTSTTRDAFSLVTPCKTHWP